MDVPVKPNEQARQIRDNFAGMHGDPNFVAGPNTAEPWNLKDYQRRVSERYFAGQQIDPPVVASYRAFGRELVDQFFTMVACGVKVEFCDYDPTPMVTRPDGTSYPSIKGLMDEFARTGVLRIYRSEDGFHPLLDQHYFRHRGPDGIYREENGNSIFRAVHDYFGHLASGGYFNWEGETTAYYSHAQMFSASARKALFCETVAQQCTYAVTGDYVEQKCVDIPDIFHRPPLA